MDQHTDRRTFLGTIGAVAGGLALSPEFADAQQKRKNGQVGHSFTISP